MKNISAFTLSVLVGLSTPFATAIAAHHTSSAASGSKPMQGSARLSEGLVKKVDKDTKTITIKHGELKDLNMPPMTMAFRVKTASMLGQVKAGDRINFQARKVGGELTVTQIVVKN